MSVIISPEKNGQPAAELAEEDALQVGADKLPTVPEPVSASDFSRLADRLSHPAPPPTRRMQEAAAVYRRLLRRDES